MKKYCTKCGAELEHGKCPNCSQAQEAGRSGRQPGTGIDPNDEKFKKLFFSPKEKYVCSLGNSFLQNFLSGNTNSRGFSVISDKRVYFKGNAFEIDGRGYTETTTLFLTRRILPSSILRSCSAGRSACSIISGLNFSSP